MLDGALGFPGEAGDGVADTSPCPVIAEEVAAGSDERGVVEKILIDVLFLVAAVDVDEVGAEVGAEKPEGCGGGGKRKRGDARSVAGMADIGEEAVIDGRVTVIAFERDEALGLGLVGSEFQSSQPRVDAEDGCFLKGVFQQIGHPDGGAAFLDDEAEAREE